MKQTGFIFISVIILIHLGCSGTGMPTVPGVNGEDTRPLSISENSSHITWGLYQFIADPDAGSLDVVSLRTGNLHLNALDFVEPPALMYLTIEGPPQYNGGIIDVDIGLRHPFLGQTQYTGFDVCGILISNGSLSGFSDPDIVMAGAPEDTYLMNPDGFSPWWNPTSFPPDLDHPIFGYKDGLLGVPDETADFNSTVCGYKYFADDLGPNDSLDMLIMDNRGVFTSGQKNVRHYKIHIGDQGLIFNYAIDASWQFPVSLPPWEAPESFAITANRPEAFHFSVTETENTLYYADDLDKGGVLGLDITVYDWQGPSTIESISAEWLGLQPPVVETVPDSVEEKSATYHIDMAGSDLLTSASIDIYLTVTDMAQHPVLGNINAYFGLGEYQVSSTGPPQDEYIEQIFYCSDHPVSRDIFSIDPAGESEPTQWTFQTDPAVWCEGPKLSPDGTKVLYLRYSWSGFGSELRIIDLETGEDISLSENGMTNWYTYGDWRHDGQKIVYSYADSIMDNGELYIMDPDGQNKELMVTTGLYPWAPTFSPDDQVVIFQSFTDSQLYMYDTVSEELTQYTDNGTWNDNPTFSPDGQFIAWATGYPTGGRHIWVSPLGSWNPPTWEIDFEQYIRSPGFSPNGEKIVFDHGGYGGAEIAIYNLFDGTWEDITDNLWGDYQADWGLMKVFD